MGYGDNRHGGDRLGGGDDRWQGRDQGGRWERERGSFGGWGSERDRERGGDWSGGSQGDDRGFFERAGEQVRSWMGSGEDHHRGGNQGHGGHRGSESFGGGFGNQRGWGDDHFDRQQGSGRTQGQGDRDRGYAGGGTRSNWGGGGGGGGGGAEPWGGSGFGGLDDNGRRFDRVDAGHVGAQGAHPMSSPVDAGYGSRQGGSGGAYGSSSRAAAIMANEGQHGGPIIDPQARDRMLGRGTGPQQGGGQSGGHHDPHYSEWRQRQIQQLDSDYEEYRREHQSKFEQDFGGWREKRQTQRQSLGRVTKQMEVIGSDGEHLGTVDKVRGDRVILTKSDANAGGVHHSIPCSWIESVDERVTINKSAQEAMSQWENEEQNRALFEREDQGSEGPHVLNRSFSGTYNERDE